MKSFIKVLIGITGVALTHSSVINYSIPAAIASDAENCFMVNSAGRVINLTSLCGNSTTPVPARTELPQQRVLQAKIKHRQAGTPVIDVTFNGKQKFEMLLDTGATQTTITQEMADALKVVPVGTAIAHVANGEVVQFPLGRVASIEAGGATVSDSMVLIGAVPLLGQNFLGSYDITIKRDVVEFHPQE